jgi:hypothetical protein
MAQIVSQDAAECSSCALLRSNLSDVMKRLGDHDMLVRMHDLATKQQDRLQKQLIALADSEANYKQQCAAMHVRHFFAFATCCSLVYFPSVILRERSIINTNAALCA